VNSDFLAHTDLSRVAEVRVEYKEGERELRVVKCRLVVIKEYLGAFCLQALTWLMRKATLSALLTVVSIFVSLLALVDLQGSARTPRQAHPTQI
jgi:hypothetical protein